MSKYKWNLIRARIESNNPRIQMQMPEDILCQQFPIGTTQEWTE